VVLGTGDTDVLTIAKNIRKKMEFLEKYTSAPLPPSKGKYFFPFVEELFYNALRKMGQLELLTN